MCGVSEASSAGDMCERFRVVAGELVDLGTVSNVGREEFAVLLKEKERRK